MAGDLGAFAENFYAPSKWEIFDVSGQTSSPLSTSVEEKKARSFAAFGENETGKPTTAAEIEDSSGRRDLGTCLDESERVGNVIRDRARSDRAPPLCGEKRRDELVARRPLGDFELVNFAAATAARTRFSRPDPRRRAMRRARRVG